MFCAYYYRADHFHRQLRLQAAPPLAAAIAIKQNTLKYLSDYLHFCFSPRIHPIREHLDGHGAVAWNLLSSWCYTFLRTGEL